MADKNRNATYVHSGRRCEDRNVGGKSELMGREVTCGNITEKRKCRIVTKEDFLDPLELWLNAPSAECLSRHAAVLGRLQIPNYTQCLSPCEDPCEEPSTCRTPSPPPCTKCPEVCGQPPQHWLMCEPDRPKVDCENICPPKHRITEDEVIPPLADHPNYAPWHRCRDEEIVPPKIVCTAPRMRDNLIDCDTVK